MNVFIKRTCKALTFLKRSKLFFIPIGAMLLFFPSCDESSVVGLEVQPTEDLLNVTIQDTVTLFTKTVTMDSLRTDESQVQLITNNVLIGTYIDPTFGKSSASLYTQLALNTDNPGFGTNPIIDSVILALVYDSVFYGKTERMQQNINVYELSEDVQIENSYFSSNTLLDNAIDLANGSAFVPNPTTSVTILGKVLKPQLRVPLTPSFGQLLLDNQGTANLSNNAAFQLFMKGFYITTQNTTSLNSGEGNILTFDLADSESKLTIYYSNDEEDSLKYDFSTASVARFSNFTHDYTSADVNLTAQLNDPSLVVNSEVFIQSMAGVKVKIDMPYIMGLNDLGTNAINKAELIIKIDTSATYSLDTFAAPEKVIVYGINDDGSDYVLLDFYEGATYFGGDYDPINKEYRVNISRYVQQLLNGELKNNGIHLLALNGAINANRVVVGGGSANSAFQMKLSITSTKLP